MNTLEEDSMIDSPHVELEEIENDHDGTVMMFSNSVIENNS
jgi:hypothetical protein